MHKPIIVIQGGQWGSEGKGMVAEALGHIRGVDFAVRTGAVNAGHTIVHDGKVYKMQQLPVGWTNPDTRLVLGPGAFIHPEILKRECDEIEADGFRVRNRLFIDRGAGLHLPTHTMRSAESGRHHKIGATGKGCSEAIVDKIRNRGSGYVNFKDYSHTDNWNICDTVRVLNDAYDNGCQILLEGTQGSALDLYLGPYPYTTHKQCNAATWIAEAGLSPSLRYEVVLCLRTFPIRVAGNSGPMPSEISWPILARMINLKLAEVGMPPRVQDWAITEFEGCLEIASENWSVPCDADGNPNVQMHTWSITERLTYKEALSELNAEAIKLMSHEGMAELEKVFELTTVTRKLRRVAMFDSEMARRAVMINRPSYAVLTFFNHWYPETWGSVMKHGFSQAQRDKLGRVAARIGCPIAAVTTGPERENFLIP
jgi:adenylosuccinate synthase